VEYLNISVAVFVAYFLFRIERRLRNLESLREKDEWRIGGNYPAFSKAQISGGQDSIDRHYKVLEKYGGILLSDEDIKTYVEKEKKAGVSEREVQKMARDYMVNSRFYSMFCSHLDFMRQANLDVLNGKRTIEDVQSEGSKRNSAFGFVGLDSKLEKAIGELEVKIGQYYHGQSSGPKP
jgi:hypothetical protein